MQVLTGAFCTCARFHLHVFQIKVGTVKPALSGRSKIDKTKILMTN